MQTIQPEQADFLLRDVSLPALENEQRITARIFAAIPADKAGYRPDEISKSAMELAWHISAAEMRFMDGIIAGGFDFSPRPRPESIETPEQLTAWYTENCASRRQQLNRLSGEQLAKSLDFRGVFQAPAVTFLDLLMRHSGHHRGQLSMYLRPMGAKVPSIYGESYDSAQSRVAGNPA